jgi:hypothetical protein
MFLRSGKNKGDEGSLFQFLLAIAAVATTAMFFSPFSEITCQFGFMFMGAAVALAAAALFTLIEMRRRRRASLGREVERSCLHHENRCEKQGQLTSNLAACTLSMAKLDPESPDPR